MVDNNIIVIYAIIIVICAIFTDICAILIVYWQ